ncbi:MAG: crotonase/enoyl-CoA hydratase family protein, partial [Gammaproteobacteria bacterium]|nr:crotonase/enoyl-CoA hydratase family protein [Gammaproteobacteria bacterium]
ELDLTTISLVHGSALGGGFEAALSSHVVIAERNAEMGLPEVLFNLFPGMGAYNLISRKASEAIAERMILSGRLYSAEELQALNIVDILAEESEGRACVHAWIRNNSKRRNTIKALRKVKELVSPVDYQQLREIGEIWVDSAFNISDRDLRTMGRLVRSQLRFSKLENKHQVEEERLYNH